MRETFGFFRGFLMFSGVFHLFMMKEFKLNTHGNMRGKATSSQSEKPLSFEKK